MGNVVGKKKITSKNWLGTHKENLDKLAEKTSKKPVEMYLPPAPEPRQGKVEKVVTGAELLVKGMLPKGMAADGRKLKRAADEITGMNVKTGRAYRTVSNAAFYAGYVYQAVRDENGVQKRYEKHANLANHFLTILNNECDLMRTSGLREHENRALSILEVVSRGVTAAKMWQAASGQMASKEKVREGK